MHGKGREVFLILSIARRGVMGYNIENIYIEGVRPL